MKFVCRGCDAVVEYDKGSSTGYNVGDAMAKTGWHYTSCAYTQKAVWLCPICGVKAKELANQLLQLTKTPWLHLPGLFDRKTLNEWETKNG